MQADALELRFGERARLVPDRIGDAEPAQIVDEGRASQGTHVLPIAASNTGGLGDQIGHSARVPGEIRALQVDQVSHRLEDVVQVGAGDTARQLGLGVEDGVPLGRLIEAVQELGCAIAKQIDQRRVELRPAMLRTIARAESIPRRRLKTSTGEASCTSRAGRLIASP